jgi:hypothetical protein
MISYSIELDQDGIRELVKKHVSEQFKLDIRDDEIRIEGSEWEKDGWAPVRLKVSILRNFDHLI